MTYRLAAVGDADRLVAAAPPVVVLTVGGEHHDREEGQGEPRLPRLDHVRRDGHEHYQHPQVGEDGPGRRQHEDAHLLDALDVRGGDADDTDGGDDKQVKGGRPDDGEGAQPVVVTRVLPQVGERDHHGQHDLGGARPERHEG